jgi:hypothetical protein
MPPWYLQRTHTVVAETEARNLRPRPPRNFVENANEEIDEDLDCEPIGDFLCANEGIITCILLYLLA